MRLKEIAYANQISLKKVLRCFYSGKKEKNLTTATVKICKSGLSCGDGGSTLTMIAVIHYVLPLMSLPLHFDIRVRTQYLADQSDPNDNRYVFAYTIRITNDGEQAAKLISRHWVITDDNGDVHEVKGQGVVGEQPYLRPGESFEYTSGTVLTTPVGTMHGSYQLQNDAGEWHDAPIPAFSLVEPSRLN
jgi:ApaG protein